jgi:hypothetical protein
VNFGFEGSFEHLLQFSNENQLGEQIFILNVLLEQKAKDYWKKYQTLISSFSKTLNLGIEC